MAIRAVINKDLADVFAQPDRKKYLHTMAWGDAIEVLETTSKYVCISTDKYEKSSDGSDLPIKTKAYICPTQTSGIKPEEIFIPEGENRVLRVNFVDVQQGDGSVIESPDGKVILVDGGDNQMFARYLAARFRNTRPEKPKPIDCILVTHGDADHFEGLMEIFKSEKNKEPKKRIFIAPKRVYHNGLVKRPSGKTVSEKELLGPTEVVDGETILTGLVDNLLQVPDKDMNEKFLEWKNALRAWNARNPIVFKRISYGKDELFDFFKYPDLKIEVIGPILTKKGNVTGLKFLGNPPKGPYIGRESLGLGLEEFKGFSASHTINGHSIVFRLQYGGFSYLFSGDLNNEASRFLAQKHENGELSLQSDVFKVPHHGSSDFSGAFLQKVAPIVSVVSSGDESARKEYIHPRATLIGALERHSRIEEPLVFVTELVAFFNLEGWSRLKDPKKSTKRGDFFAFSRDVYGIVKTRTDGKRLLVYTDSGKSNLKEAYCFTLDAEGRPVPATVVRV